MRTLTDAPPRFPSTLRPGDGGKVFARLEMMNKGNFTVDDVYDRIGLSTNCTELTDAQWAKQQISKKINARAIEVIQRRNK